jgi:hypothetical protein
MLVESGADPRIANKKKLTSIHAAKTPGIRALLQRVANGMDHSQSMLTHHFNCSQHHLW